MKAVVCTRYGPPEVLRYEDIPIPECGPHDILVKVHTTTITAGDCELRRFDMPASIWLIVRIMFGIFKPRTKVFGQEFSGEVVEVGNKVTRFSKGDEIFGPAESLGAHAEYLKLKDTKSVAFKPPSISHAQATTTPVGGMNAIHFLEVAKVKPGDKILIIGAGGSIGTYAIQIATSLGAEVTAVDRGSKAEMLKAAGAARVIDYLKEDFGADGPVYDVVFDIIGRDSFSRGIQSTKKGGLYLITNIRFSQIIGGWFIGKLKGKHIKATIANYSNERLETLAGMIEDGTVKPLIDPRKFTLEEVIDGHRYVETGEKQGCLVVNVYP